MLWTVVSRRVRGRVAAVITSAFVCLTLGVFRAAALRSLGC